MRITNNMMLNNSMNNINGNKINVNNMNNQMSSQKKIQRPSENPVIAIRSLRLRSDLSEIGTSMRIIFLMRSHGLMLPEQRSKI